MPLKIESEYDISLEVNKEPLYNELNMQQYATNKGIAINELSEKEKEMFIVGYLSL